MMPKRKPVKTKHSPNKVTPIDTPSQNTRSAKRRRSLAILGVSMSLVLRPVAALSLSGYPPRPTTPFYVCHVIAMLCLGLGFIPRRGDIAVHRLWTIRVLVASAIASALPLYWSALYPTWEGSVPRSIMAWMAVPAFVALVGAKVPPPTETSNAVEASGYRTTAITVRSHVAQQAWNFVPRYLLAVPIVFGSFWLVDWQSERVALLLCSPWIAAVSAIAAYGFTRSTFEPWRRRAAAMNCGLPAIFSLVALVARRLPHSPPPVSFGLWAPELSRWDLLSTLALPWVAIFSLSVVLWERGAPEKFV